MNSTETGGDRIRSLAQSQLRLRCTPGYGYPPLVTPFGASVQILADQLLENEWRSPEEIKRRQFEQLKALLRFAREQCPFYTERMNSCGLDPEAMSSFEDFERMPEETTRIQAWLGDPGHLELLRTYCQVVQTLRMIQATEIFEEEYVDEDEDEGEEE